MRPRDKGQHEALPRLAFVAAGRLAGLRLARPLAAAVRRQLRADGRAASASLGPRRAAASRLARGRGRLAARCAAGWLVSRPLNRVLGRFFGLFNRGFDGDSQRLYPRWSAGCCGSASLVLVVYGGLLVLTYWSFVDTPKGFIPTQDMGYLLVNVQLPDAASVERTERVMRQIDEIATRTPGVTATRGDRRPVVRCLSAYGSNFGSMFVILDDFADRRDGRRWLLRPKEIADLRASAEAAMQRPRFPRPTVAVFGPPPVRGVGRAGGFDADGRRPRRPRARRRCKSADRQPGETGRPGSMRDSPRQRTSAAGSRCSARRLPRQRAAALRRRRPRGLHDEGGRAAATSSTRCRSTSGSLYVNDFNLFGRTWQVIVQADAKFRDQVDDVTQLKVRNSRGHDGARWARWPTCARSTGRWCSRATTCTRPPPINGSAAPGVSSRQAIDADGATGRPGAAARRWHYEWTEMAYLELQAGNTAMIIFGFAVVMVFLVLAAQYESWSLPLAVILVVPMCLLSAIAGVNVAAHGHQHLHADRLRGAGRAGQQERDPDRRVRQAAARGRGMPRREATLEACRLRLRPIVMTSLAFILGVVPLVVAHGAGAEMRRTLGTAVFSGMLGVTLFGIFLTPVFFYVIDWPWPSRRFFANPAGAARSAESWSALVPFVLCRELFRLACRRVLMRSQAKATVQDRRA